MDDVSPIPTSVSAYQGQECLHDCASAREPVGARSTVELQHNRARRQQTNRQGDEGHDMPDPSRIEHSRGEKSQRQRRENMAPEIAGTGLPPGNERADARQEEEGQTQWDIDLVKEWRGHADLDAAHGFREQGKQRAPEYDEHDAHQEQVIK